MAEHQEGREKISLDFGIESTQELGGSDSSLVLDGLFGNPEDVKIKGNSSSTTETTSKKPVEPQKKEEKPNPSNKKDQPGTYTPSAEELLNLGNEDNESNEGEGDNSEETENEDSNKEENEGGDENPYALMAKDLLRLGVFSKDEDEKDEDFNFEDPREFLGRFQYEIKKGISDGIGNYLSRYGKDYQDMFDAVFVKGVSPQAYLQTFTKLQDMSQMDMSKEADQERVYREYWRRQGYPADKVEAKLQRAKVNGELEEDSTEFHRLIVDQDNEELQAQQEEAEQRQLRKLEARKMLAKNTHKLLSDKLPSKDFDGIPLSQQVAQQALDFVTKEKYKLNGETLTEFDKYILELQKPENHALKVKMALLMLNNFDLSKVKVKQQNENTEELFRFATKTKDGKKTNTTAASRKASVIDDKF